MKRRELLQRSAALGLGAAFPKAWELSANAEQPHGSDWGSSRRLALIQLR